MSMILSIQLCELIKITVKYQTICTIAQQLLKWAVGLWIKKKK